MQRRGLFIVSLLIIILLSWANVDYFGTVKTNVFSPAVNQVVHIVAFLATAVIGYINWRKEERWVSMLWLGLYALVLAAFIATVIIFGITHNEIIKRVGAGLRNRFTEPLPFLVFYIFIVLTKRFRETGTSANG